MKRLLILAASLAGMNLVMAQTKKAKPAMPKAKHTSAIVYLGNSLLTGGLVSKSVFDSLVNQGLTAKDSFGVEGKVVQFRIYYKERNLYEDSVGRMYFDTELLTDFSRGNKLNSYMGSSITSRTKKGDTAIFDDIVVMMPDSVTVQGHFMTFVIGK